jgi:cullin-4
MNDVNQNSIPSTIRRFPISIYVLQLTDGCYYVGQSCHLPSRIAEHFSGKGSAWTRLHTPEVVLCARTLRTLDWKIAEKAENRLTRFLMSKFGWKNVRGGYWSNVCNQSIAANLRHHGFDSLVS